MADIVDAFAETFGDLAIPGVPAGGPKPVSKQSARALGQVIEDRVASVEAIATAGVRWTTQIVRVRSTANVDIATGLENGDTLNGVTLATGDVVFLGSQTDPAQNGLYTVAASGAAARAAFADSAAELAHIGFLISEGSDGAGERWTLPLDEAGIILGTTALTFAPIGIEVSYAEEVATARGDEPTLADRLAAIDTVAAEARGEALVSQAALYGITDPAEARSLMEGSIELEFAAGRFRHGLTVTSSLSAFPGFSFARAAAATAYDAARALIPFASGEPRLTSAGLTVEPGRTNKCAAYNANPSEAVGATTITGLSAGATVVDDSAAIAAAGLDQVCTSGKAYRVDNSAGGSAAFIVVTGQTGNTNPHAVSAYIRASTSFTDTVLALSGTDGEQDNVTTSYQRFSQVVTPAGTTAALVIRAPAGKIVTFILFQLEEGLWPTMPIITTGTAALRSFELPKIADLAIAPGSTVVAEFAYLGRGSEAAPDTRLALTLTGASGADRVVLFNAADGALAASVEVGSSVTATSGSADPADEGEMQRLALRVANDSVRLARDGSLGDLDSSGDVPEVLTEMGLGVYPWGDFGGGVLIKRVAVLPIAAGDGQLQELTGATEAVDGPEWVRLGTAAFSKRDSARTFEMGGWRYIGNGYEIGDVSINDLWRTANGVDYQLVNASPTYDNRAHMQAVGTTIYAWGATTTQKSTDGGVTFTPVAGAVPFQQAIDNPSWVVNGKIQTLAGNGTADAGNDGVWEFDTDTETWSRIATPAWGSRALSAVCVFNGAIYLQGGVTGVVNTPPEISYPTLTTLNDLWRSTDDGVTWTQIVADLPCEPRMWPVLVEFDGAMYLLGGWNNRISPGVNFDDTWRTTDGTTWEEVPTTTDYLERHAPVAYAFGVEERLILISGNANDAHPDATLNDVWEFQS